jgi:hypothetical protein
MILEPNQAVEQSLQLWRASLRGNQDADRRLHRDKLMGRRRTGERRNRHLGNDPCLGRLFIQAEQRLLQLVEVSRPAILFGHFARDA